MPVDQQGEEQLGFTAQHRITAEQLYGSASPCDCACEISGSCCGTRCGFEASRRFEIVNLSASANISRFHTAPPLPAVALAAVCSASQRWISASE